MSGGMWGNQSETLHRDADRTALFLHAVAQSERIVDWAVSGDVSRLDAARELFDLWRDTFYDAYRDGGDD